MTPNPALGSLRDVRGDQGTSAGARPATGGTALADLPPVPSIPGLPQGLRIRTITPEDADALRAFHRTLSPETVYRRFFAPHPELSEKEARRFCELDPETQMALVAEIDGQMIAIGRYNRYTQSDVAEVAFVVADRYQGQGVGSILLARLTALAWQRGIHVLVADTLFSNRAMIEVFQRSPWLKLVKVGSNADVTHLVMEITPPASVGGSSA